LKPYEYDPEKAKKLLDEAGWKDTDNDGILDKNHKKFEFKLLFATGNIDGERMLNVVKESMQKIGVDMNIELMEWAVFIKFIEEGKFDATSLGWSLGWEQDPYQLWHSSQIPEKVKGGSNHCNFVNKEADEIIEKAREEFDTQKRNTMYKRLQAIMHEEQPYTFLFTRKSLIAYDKRIHNLKTYPIRPGYNVLEWFVPLQVQKYK
jgi:peptide/nickel transport system substrate-binding protein